MVEQAARHLSVICPVYNEEDNLRELAARISTTLDSHYGKQTWELILADDHSTDKSWAVAQSLAEKDARIRPIRNPRRSGQTGGFKTGFAHACGEIVVTMDADLQVRPEDIPLLVDEMDRGFDLVNAIRTKRQHAPAIKVASRVYNLLMKVFFRSPVSDAASNFTAIEARYVKQLPLVANDHRYLIPILQDRGLTRINEIKIYHQERTRGKSKYSLMKAVTGFPELLAVFFRIRKGDYRWPQ